MTDGIEFGSNSAFIVARIKDDGTIRDISIYSAGSGCLTVTGRDCHYAQLGIEFRGRDYAQACEYAEAYYKAAHAALAKRFPLR